MQCSYCDKEMASYKDHVGKYECEPACGQCVSKYRRVYDMAKKAHDAWVNIKWVKSELGKNVHTDDWRMFYYTHLQNLSDALLEIE